MLFRDYIGPNVQCINLLLEVVPSKYTIYISLCSIY